MFNILGRKYFTMKTKCYMSQKSKLGSVLLPVYVAGSAIPPGTNHPLADRYGNRIMYVRNEFIVVAPGEITTSFPNVVPVHHYVFSLVRTVMPSEIVNDPNIVVIKQLEDISYTRIPDGVNHHDFTHYYKDEDDNWYNYLLKNTDTPYPLRFSEDNIRRSYIGPNRYGRGDFPYENKISSDPACIGSNSEFALRFELNLTFIGTLPQLIQNIHALNAYYYEKSENDKIVPVPIPRECPPGISMNQILADYGHLLPH